MTTATQWEAIDLIDDAPSPTYPWQPHLWEAETGVLLTVCQMWFQTETACVEWIEQNLIGATLRDDR